MIESKYRAFSRKFGNIMIMPGDPLYSIDVINSTVWQDCRDDEGAIIMQAIGLKDAAGQDIYEDDWLDFDETVWGGAFKIEVVPSLHEFVKGWPLCGTYSDVSQYRRVRGNFHQNPLKKPKRKTR